ncbi:MAG: polysaccharide deacetylase family protein [Bacteroidetes bacterium]|nr:polysaccharide deacetylase family protein [Bacteroidota bacterium]
MLRFLLFIYLIISFNAGFAQNSKAFSNKKFLKKLKQDVEYMKLKKRVVHEYIHAKPGHWGEFVKGVDEDLATQQKYVAFTFDACGGEKGSGYDKELIEYLRREKIPATLFITGKWIDSHFETFLELSKDSLFEIENHGLNHKPCSVDGESEYGIRGTANVGDAFDEIEANAKKIEALTNYKPKFFRSATAFIDEACARMAFELGIITVSFQVLSGDAVANTPDSVITANVLTTVKPGAIIIMHFNHPKWNTFEAMQKIVPELRKRGYLFARLNKFPLKSNKN